MTNKDKSVLIPVVSEKASAQIKNNKYTFLVLDNSNKIEIQQYFFKKYQVKPTKVNVINRIGKKVRRGKSTGYTPDRRFAIVTFSDADNVDAIRELF